MEGVSASAAKHHTAILLVAGLWMMADDSWRRALFTWARAYPACGSICPQTLRRSSDGFSGSMFLYPLTLQVFLVPLPNAAIYICSSYLVTFHNYSLCTIKKKMPGQMRSGHQSGFVDTTTEKFAIMSELEFFFHEAVSSLQVLITVPVCVLCISHNIYIYMRPKLRQESWSLHYKPMGK